VLCFNGNLVQVVYELKAGGVDERRLVGAKLEKLAEGETGSILFKILSMNIQSCSVVLLHRPVHLLLMEVLELSLVIRKC